MNSSAQETRDRILELATELLQNRGFNGFSYKDIATPLGVKNAAIHYHYPSKADLAMALVERYLDVLKNGTRQFMASGGSAAEQIEKLFHFTLHEVSHGRCGCPFGAFAVDFESLPDSVRSATRRFHERSLEWMTKVMKLGREQGELNFEGAPEDRALALLSTVQGARQIARLMGMDQVQRILDQEKRDLGMKAD